MTLAELERRIALRTGARLRPHIKWDCLEAALRGGGLEAAKS